MRHDEAMQSALLGQWVNIYLIPDTLADRDH